MPVTDASPVPPAGGLPARARALAVELHAGQRRKGSGVTYVDGHLDPVAELVRDSGGSEAQVAAAYLHDAAEDAGGRATLDRIASEIDPHVAELVAALSDSLVDTTSDITKVPWLDRKPAYIAKLATEPDEVLEVSVADKLQNAGSFLADYRGAGPETWARFNESRAEYQLWYYEALAQVFRARLPEHPLTHRLTDVLAEVRALVRADVPDIDERVDAAFADMARRDT